MHQIHSLNILFYTTTVTIITVLTALVTEDLVLQVGVMVSLHERSSFLDLSLAMVSLLILQIVSCRLRSVYEYIQPIKNVTRSNSHKSCRHLPLDMSVRLVFTRKFLVAKLDSVLNIIVTTG